MDITESIDNVFLESTMTGGTIRNVLLFGGSSKNNRHYTEQSIDDLVNLSESGAKAFLDHPSRTDIKDRQGVRSVRDWLGSFSGIRKAGRKIYGNLKVRESFQPLMKDIVSMRPNGVGFSLNGQVFAREKDGKDIIESVKKIRSYDLVSSAATVNSIFESHIEKIEEDKDIREAQEKFCKDLGIHVETGDVQEATNKFLKDFRR